MFRNYKYTTELCISAHIYNKKKRKGKEAVCWVIIHKIIIINIELKVKKISTEMKWKEGQRKHNEKWEWKNKEKK